MKKLELKRINLEEAGITQSDIITKKQQRHILGGYGFGDTCCWQHPMTNETRCCISQTEAFALFFYVEGSFMGCDSFCWLTAWCGEDDCDWWG
jgi:hypothetical protein